MSRLAGAGNLLYKYLDPYNKRGLYVTWARLNSVLFEGLTFHSLKIFDIKPKFSNQPIQLHNFGSSFIVPRILIPGYFGPYEVVVTCLTSEGRPHPHSLEGPGCREGICVFKGGGEDRFIKVLERIVQPTGQAGLHVNVKRRAAVVSSRISFEAARHIARSLLWKLKGVGTMVKIPDLRISAAGEYGVQGALAQRERISARRAVSRSHPKLLGPVAPLGDPFITGFGHKKLPVDLSAVRLSFDITLLTGTGDMLLPLHHFQPLVCDVIYDSLPRVLAMSERESRVEGGGVLRLKVNRDDVRVEFYHSQPEAWSCWANMGAREGAGFKDIDTREELAGPYVAELEVEVPEYPGQLRERREVFVRLVTLGEGVRGVAASFHYLPSETGGQEVEEEVKGDFITAALEAGQKEEYNYLASLRRETAHLPREPVVLRPVVRERREEQGLAATGSKDYRRRAGLATINKIFKT